MKKIFFSLILMIASFASFSQSCEERENKLLETMGTLSAGFLYNTYGLIGSIADGYENNVYDAAAVTELVNAQMKLADNMIAFLEKMVADNIFKDDRNKNFVTASADIIKGLKKQAGIVLDLVSNRSKKNLDAYDEQRNKNWKDISKLMGIKE